MRVQNESDIRSGESIDVLYYMLEHSRSEWKSIVEKYISETDPNGRIRLNGSRHFINATLDSFDESFRGKYNLGNYVTTKNKGGKYRIVGLPYLDYRWKDHWDGSFGVDIERIEQFGLNYTLAGIDDNGELSGSEYYLYFESSNEYGVSLKISDTFEDNLELINPEDPTLIDEKASVVFELE